MSGIVVGIGQGLLELCTLNAAKKGKSIGPHVIKMCDADGCWRWKGYDRTSKHTNGNRIWGLQQ